MLSHRLQSLHNLYRNEQHVWDIGCDHALLGLSFVEKERVQGIHLVDPSIEVMRDLTNKLTAAHIPRKDLIKTYPTTGQQLNLNSSSNLIFIAGMGGKEIQDILNALVPQMSKEDRVVVAPHRKQLELRNWLSTSELKLETEFCLEENHQFYEILVLTKAASTAVSLYGDAIWRGECGERYRSQILQAFAHHKDRQSQELLAYLKGLSP